MLGKLLKYDMKSMLRQFVPLWILAPFVAVMLGLSMRSSGSYHIGSFIHRSTNEVLVLVMALVFGGVMIALLVMTILFIIQRFWNGLLKEEGYLMFTLPVETWELITSKGVAATLVTIISAVSAAVSFVLMILCTSHEILWALEMALDKTAEVFFQDYYSGQHWITVILWILIGVLSITKSIYHVYAAMAIGHLSSRHRIAASCIAYVGISVVLSMIGSAIMGIAENVSNGNWQYEMQEMFGASGMIASLVILLAITVVQIIIFHVITERILDTRLNLE